MHITGSGIKSGEDFIPMAAISGVNVRKVDGETRRSARSVTIGLLGWAALLGGLAQLRSDQQLAVFLIGGGIVLWIASGLFRKKLYALQLVTNAGQQSLFTNTSKTFLIEVRDAIITAMDRRGSGVNIQVNNDNRQIEDKSVTNISITYDFSYNITHHHGTVPDETLAAVRARLDELTRVVEARGDEAAKRDLETLLKELSARKPDRGVLERAWTGLKEASSAVQIYETVRDAGAVIWPFIVAITA